MGSNFDNWQHLHEELQLHIFLYLNANDLITLCYVSKCFRKLVLKKFAKYYDLSTGFCSVKYWTHEIEKNVFRLVEAIHSELFDSYAFDFERNYDKLIKKFRYMPLFSVYFHFLRCRRSCERKLGYCKVCSGVRENTFYEYNAFLNLIVDSTTGDYLNISGSEQIDLDVFLNKPAYFPYCHCESIGKSSDFEFSFARDLFAAFCSVLVRMYLNHTTESFSDLMSQVSLTNGEKK